MTKTRTRLHWVGDTLTIFGLLMMALNWGVITYQAGGIGLVILGFTFIAPCTVVFPLCSVFFGSGTSLHQWVLWFIYGAMALVGVWLSDRFKR
jgi:hypothetical protein